MSVQPLGDYSSFLSGPTLRETGTSVAVACLYGRKKSERPVAGRLKI